MLHAIEAAHNGRPRILRIKFWIERDVPNTIVSAIWFDNKTPIVVEPGQPFFSEMPSALFPIAWDEYVGLAHSFDKDVRFMIEEERRKRMGLFGPIIGTAIAAVLVCGYIVHQHYEAIAIAHACQAATEVQLAFLR